MSSVALITLDRLGIIAIHGDFTTVDSFNIDVVWMGACGMHTVKVRIEATFEIDKDFSLKNALECIEEAVDKLREQGGAEATVSIPEPITMKI